MMKIPIRRYLKNLLVDDTGRWTNLYYLLLATPQNLKIRHLVECASRNACDVIDIGSRRSPYTRRLQSHIVFLDLLSDTGGYLGFTEELRNVLSNLTNTKVVYGSATQLPFDERSFDVALCIDVIEHIQDDTKAVSEICRVVKKGGRALFTTPNGEIIPNRNPHHCRHYTPWMFRDLLRRQFSSVDVWTECPWPTWENLLWRTSWNAENGRSSALAISYCFLRLVYILGSAIVPRSWSGPGILLVGKCIK